MSDTPTGSMSRPRNSEIAGLDPEARLVRVETLVSVIREQAAQLERRQGKQEAATVRIESRMAHMEGKLDELLTCLGAVGTKQVVATTTVGAAIVVVQQILAVLS